MFHMKSLIPGKNVHLVLLDTGSLLHAGCIAQNWSQDLSETYQGRGIVTTDLFLTERLYKTALRACISYLNNVLKCNA